MLSWSPPLRKERARMGHPRLGDADKTKRFSGVGHPLPPPAGWLGKSRTKIKGSGQECPLHTNYLQLL
jgi:hypothetical protein